MEAHKINILVIEDNKDHLFFIKKALASEKYNLKIITDGATAYNYLLNPTQLVDIVLLDQYLPNMHGLEILKKLQPLKPPYRIIFMSVDNSLDTKYEALKLGALNFVSKEASIGADLLKSIEALTQLSNHDSF
jgi:two-component system phosphoglycerate transport system response regulator PgtA